MPEIPSSTFINFFVYLSIPFLFAFIAKQIKLPAVIGYMIGGVVLGNLFTDLVSRETINQFAFFGIVLLLFTVGLEVNFERMLAMRRFILIGGSFQVLISIVAILFLSLFFGFSLLQAFLIGIALSSSSTALVAKIIEDRGEEGSFLGELALGVLMFQDLAFIPFIIIFTSITSHSISFVEITSKIFLDLIISSAIIITMFYLGKKIVPIIFNQIASVSRELLNFFIIVFIFLIALFSTLFKIPILIGIFIAGVLVSQTLEHYHIFSRIKPLRDILAVIFFIYIGSNVGLGQVIPNAPQILLFSAFVILLKVVITFFTFIHLKFSTRMAFYTSISLFQIDEDAFILMSLALSNKIFSEEQYLFIITATLLSLILTPILMGNRETIYLSIRAFIRKNFPKLEKLIKGKLDFTVSPIDVLSIKNHVVICGYGRVGSRVGKALQLANIPFIAVDYNYHTVDAAKRDGVDIIYGDPTDIDVLDFVECEHAVALIAAVPSKFDQEAIIINAKKLNPEIFIISRVQSDSDNQRFKDLGAKAVIQPELEASASIIKKILILKRVPKEEIVKSLKHLKLIHGAL